MEQLTKQIAYSLGYEGIKLSRYVEILQHYKVILVVDVRETPWSHKADFCKKALETKLSEVGIRYLHLKSAGNPAQNRKLGLSQPEVINLYKKHLDLNPNCLEQIASLIQQEAGAVCLLCFEEQAHDCHRKVILDRITVEHENIKAEHLLGYKSLLKQTRIAYGVPEPDDSELVGIHVEVA